MHIRVSYALSVIAASLISTAALLFIFSGLQYQSTLSGLDSAIRYYETGNITKDIQPAMLFRRYQYEQIYRWNPEIMSARRDGLTMFGSSAYRNIWTLILQSPVDKVAALIGIAIFANALAITAGSYIARLIFHKIDVFILWSEVPKRRSILLVNPLIRRLTLSVTVPASIVASLITWRLTTGIHFGSSLLALDRVLLSPEDIAVYFCALISLDIFLVNVLTLFLRNRFFSGFALGRFRRCSVCGYHVGRLQPCPECGITQRQWSRRHLFLLTKYFAGISLLGFALTVTVALSMSLASFYDNVDSLKSNLVYATMFVALRPTEKHSSPVSLNYSNVIEIENNTHRAMILVLPYSEVANRSQWDSKVYTKYVWAYLRQPLDSDPSNKEQWDISVFSHPPLTRDYTILDDLSIITTQEFSKNIKSLRSSYLFTLTPIFVMSDPPIDRPLDIQPDTLCFINQSRNGVWNPELVSEIRTRLRQAITDR